MSAFSSGLPSGLQTVGLYTGMSIAAFGCVATGWYLINLWRENNSKSPLRLDPNYVILIALLVAASAVGWQIYQGPAVNSASAAEVDALKRDLAEAKKVPPAAVNPPKAPDTTLMEAALAFAARNGMKPIEIQNAIEIRDGANGRGPYISRWDHKAGPWPTEADGFAAYQVHALPAKHPAIKIQAARDDLGEALKRLSLLVNQKVLGMADRANSVRAVLPPQANISLEADYWERLLPEVDEIFGLLAQVEKFFAEQPLANEYPLLRAEIIGTCSVPPALLFDFKDALEQYRAFMRVMSEVGHSDKKARFQASASLLYPAPYQALTRASDQVRAWVTDCNRRIDMMNRAL
jgi:hypothetical protein